MSRHAALSKIHARKELKAQMARTNLYIYYGSFKLTPDRFGTRRKARKELVALATGKKVMCRFVIASTYPKFFNKWWRERF